MSEFTWERGILMPLGGGRKLTPQDQLMLIHATDPVEADSAPENTTMYIVAASQP